MEQNLTETRSRVTQLMLRLGISMGAAGWDYLREAILLRCGETLSEGELFSRTAARCGVSTAAVREGCRSAVLRAYAGGRPAQLDGFLPDGKPLSCGGFIAQCAALLQKEAEQ